MSARVPALTLAAALAVLAPACSDDELPEEQAPPARYVQDVTCSGCHAEVWAEWTGSHHDLAMQLATPATVLGNFDDTRFEQGDVTTRFFRRAERFVVETSGPDRAPEEFEVRYVLGVEPLQQVLIELPGGRVQCLTIAWDTRRAEWFSLHPGEVFEAGDARHWSGRYQRWNATCAACHTTALEKGYDEASDTYDTRWAELHVGCQACHGPGSNHLTWSTEYDQTLDPTRGLELHLERGATRSELAVCAPCHSNRQPLVGAPHPGLEFLDGFAPDRLGADLYYPDGQPRGNAYVYGSFVQSRMHASGVGCSDCHAAHSLELIAEGNALCTRCHSSFAPVERFPTLRVKNYDTHRHHFHERETPGAACVNCHMPEHANQVIDARRDHSFRVPRPDLSVALGVPNACNDCHAQAEQDAAWAVARLEEWYGTERTAVPHFAPTLARGRADLETDEEVEQPAGPALGLLAADTSQPGIVRATALDLLQDLDEPGAEILRRMLDDPDALVRSSAARAFELLPTTRRQAVVELLADPVRAVRISAARTLVAFPRADLEPHQVAALEAATAEFRTAVELSSDLPEAHVLLARFHAQAGDTTRALEAWRRALAHDPQSLATRLELADLLHATGDDAETERVLREGLELAPDDSGLHHALGLLLLETQRLDAAADALSTAARLSPADARSQYDAGLALAQVGRDEEAEQRLMDAALLAPRDPLPRHALVVFHLRRGGDERALEHARVLTGLVPDSPQPQILLERIRETTDP